MKKPILFSLFSLFFVANLAAQYEDLMNDKNIVWIAEYDTDFGLQALECWNASNKAPFWYSHTDIKFLNQDQKEGYYGAHSYPTCNWIYEKIMQGLLGNRHECYSDEKMRTPLSPDDVLSMMSKIDTVVTFNPENYEERVMIVRNDLNVEDIIGIRARMVYFYDEKKRSFGGRLLAYAPLMKQINPDHYAWEGHYQSLLWIKAPQDAAKKWQKRVASPDVTWAVQVKPQMGVLEFDKLNVMKRQIDLPDIVKREVKSPGRPCYNYEMELVAQLDIDKNISQVDTVVTFDPETYEEKMTIVRSNSLDHIKSLNMTYVWYYDEKRQQLYLRPTFSIILLSVHDENGNFRYSKPVFYQKID